MNRSIVVDKIAKTYQLGENRHTMLREALAGLLSRAWKPKTPAAAKPRDTVRALDGVSFEVDQGEVVGLVGRNGAGKSTLLKILSRITYPSSGRMDVTGRIGSLLEVGTGFHEELTGRENIYLNGSILGMRKREIDASLKQIIEFADVGDFLETPIKRYSSGMRMRLGFSVAAHLRTEVLFVDEVLAVGDAGFQKKCLGTMRELGQGGRTLIFVSHNMAAIENLCQRTIWIANGQVKQDGPSKEVIRAYLQSFSADDGQPLDLTSVPDRKGSGMVRLRKMEYGPDGKAGTIHSGDPLTIRLHYECLTEVTRLHFGVRIYSSHGLLVTEASSWITDQLIDVAPKGRGSADLEIDFLNLQPGTYYVGLWASGFEELHDSIDNVARLEVEPSNYFGTGRGIHQRLGLMFLPHRWHVNQPVESAGETANDGAALCG